MTNFSELVWPRLTESVDDKERREDSLKRDIAAIKATIWKKEVLDQARSLDQEEKDRKQVADTKASVYLAVIAAIVPILSSLGADFFVTGFTTLSPAHQAVTLFLFILGTSYFMASGLWAFRTLAVSVHHRVDVTELLDVNKEMKTEEALIRNILLATRRNRDGVNKKISYIVMTYKFLIRTFIVFTLLILVMVLWESLIAISDFAAALSRNW